MNTTDTTPSPPRPAPAPHDLPHILFGLVPGGVALTGLLAFVPMVMPIP